MQRDGTDAFLLGTITPSNALFSSNWRNFYEGVIRANNAIANITAKSPSATTKKARLIAESKFLRAYYYFRLNQVWKGVPIYTEPLKYDQFTKARSTEQEVWDLVIKDLSDAIAMDPIGALTSLLPTWFLIPFALIAILGLVGGAILDLYSSGLALVSIGVPIKRHQAAIIDALIMLAGCIYIVWIADNFFYPFQGFLITLGVPVAVWSAIFVADVLMRKKAYIEKDLYDAHGIYGSINKGSIALMAIGTVVGWGFVTNTFATWLSWQGYFLGLIGGKEGPWAFANVGVIFALVIGFVGHILLSFRKIQAQENALS